MFVYQWVATWESLIVGLDNMVSSFLYDVVMEVLFCTISAVCVVKIYG